MRFIALMLAIFLFSCATCPNCSPEKRWLLEDADIHIRFVRWGRGQYYENPIKHIQYAERFRKIASYIDGGKIDKAKIEADISFLKNCLYLHTARNAYNPNWWDKLWIKRYERILKRMYEIKSRSHLANQGQ